MNINNQGSYRFGTFQNNEAELTRLKQQATYFINTETNNLQRAGLNPGHKVLDIGCGPGFISCELAKFVGNGSVMGVDINNILLTIANKEKNARNITNVTFCEANIYQLDLLKQEFDFVYCRFVFQHLSDPQLALQSIYSILKPGGIVCITDIDDGYVSLYPESKGFDSLVQRTIANVKEQSGDRLVGRKLHSYLSATGYHNVSKWADVLTSSAIGIKNFIDVTCSVRARLAASQSEYDAAEEDLKDIYTMLDAHPEAWAAAAVFMATGTK